MFFLFNHGSTLMKTMEYTGFTRKACFCRYQVAQLDGQQVVIFEQSARIQTSITNMMQELVNQVLASDLRGEEPCAVRFFEYFPPHPERKVGWQEVTFRDAIPIYKKTGWRGKIRTLLGTTQTPEMWSVNGPGWNPVTTQMKAQLQSIMN